MYPRQWAQIFWSPVILCNIVTLADSGQNKDGLAIWRNNFRNLYATVPPFQIESWDKTRIFRDSHWSLEPQQWCFLSIFYNEHMTRKINSSKYMLECLWFTAWFSLSTVPNENPLRAVLNGFSLSTVLNRFSLNTDSKDSLWAPCSKKWQQLQG